MNTNKENDGRYPYTYSCDYIRHFGPVSSKGVVLSRSDASQIRKGIAEALGLTDENLAIKLADYYKLNEDNLSKEAADKLLVALGFS